MFSLPKHLPLSSKCRQDVNVIYHIHFILAGCVNSHITNDYQPFPAETVAITVEITVTQILLLCSNAYPLSLCFLAEKKRRALG